MFKFYLLCILLNSSLVNASQLVIWNVGQGQWVSEISSRDCFHSDLGGEKSPLFRVLKECREKMNYIHLSHWDLDHVSYVRDFASRLKRVCLMEPATPPPSQKKKSLIEHLPVCKPDKAQEYFKKSRIIYHPLQNKDSNASSEVIFSRLFATLIPGDSPRSQEKVWAELAPSQTKGLILGHHGSRTSTSAELLESLPNLKWAVATARMARYGHPHQEVVRALKKEKVPLLKTEDWGHLHFMKNDED